MTATALVTGASRGIGRATALALAAEGFDIAADALGDADRLDTLAQEVGALGRRCLGLELDICDLDAHGAAIERVRRELGAVDCEFLRSLAAPVAKPSVCAFWGPQPNQLLVTSILPASGSREQPGLNGAVFALDVAVVGLA